MACRTSAIVLILGLATAVALLESLYLYTLIQLTLPTHRMWGILGSLSHLV